MSITHGWTSAATPDGSDVTPTNMNDHAWTGVGSDGTVLAAVSADVAWQFVLPDIQNITGGWSGSSSALAITVASVTGRTYYACVGSASAGPTSITQTNVTWTQLYTGDDGSRWTELWKGVPSGTPGTTATVNFAVARKVGVSMWTEPVAYTSATAIGTSTGGGARTVYASPTPSLGAEIAVLAYPDTATNTYSSASQPIIVVGGGQPTALRAHLWGPTFQCQVTPDAGSERLAVLSLA